MKINKEPTAEQLLESANTWEARANEHIRLADFCHEQADRFLGHISVPDDYRPSLTLIHGEKDSNNGRTT